MCFSATASFAASALLTGVGVMALRAVRRPEERLFALVPLLFATQQLTEGLVWMSYPWAAPTLRGQHRFTRYFLTCYGPLSYLGRYARWSPYSGVAAFSGFSV